MYGSLQFTTLLRRCFSHLALVLAPGLYIYTYMYIHGVGEMRGLRMIKDRN